MMNYQEIINWLDRYNICGFVVNDDMTVDVWGDVYLAYYALTALPFQFGKVMGNFSCHSTKLTTFKNVPHYIEGNFSFYATRIQSLQYFPKTIGGSIVHYPGVM